MQLGVLSFQEGTIVPFIKMLNISQLVQAFVPYVCKTCSIQNTSNSMPRGVAFLHALCTRASLSRHVSKYVVVIESEEASLAKWFYPDAFTMNDIVMMHSVLVLEENIAHTDPVRKRGSTHNILMQSPRFHVSNSLLGKTTKG